MKKLTDVLKRYVQEKKAQAEYAPKNDAQAEASLNNYNSTYLQLVADRKIVSVRGDGKTELDHLINRISSERGYLAENGKVNARTLGLYDKALGYLKDKKNKYESRRNRHLGETQVKKEPKPNDTGVIYIQKRPNETQIINVSTETHKKYDEELEKVLKTYSKLVKGNLVTKGIDYLLKKVKGVYTNLLIDRAAEDDRKRIDISMKNYKRVIGYLEAKKKSIEFDRMAESLNPDFGEHEEVIVFRGNNGKYYAANKDAVVIGFYGQVHSKNKKGKKIGFLENGIYKPRSKSKAEESIDGMVAKIAYVEMFDTILRMEGAGRKTRNYTSLDDAKVLENIGDRQLKLIGQKAQELYKMLEDKDRLKPLKNAVLAYYQSLSRVAIDRGLFKSPEQVRKEEQQRLKEKGVKLYDSKVETNAGEVNQSNFSPKDVFAMVNDKSMGLESESETLLVK